MGTDGPSTSHSPQPCYSTQHQHQHQPYLLVHARQCCHILGEQGSRPAESLLQTQVHIHKTCYKFFSEVKTATNSKCSVLLFFGQQFPVCPIASNGLCNRQRVPESKKLKAQSVESTTTQVTFLYCSTGFTLTSKKEQTSTKA